MFGLSINGEETVAEARSNPKEKTTLTKDLVDIAAAEGLEFQDEDVNFVVIYDTQWDINPNMTETSEVVLSDWISDTRGVSFNPCCPGSTHSQSSSHLSFSSPSIALPGC
jgi:hypothetical protein